MFGLDTWWGCRCVINVGFCGLFAMLLLVCLLVVELVGVLVGLFCVIVGIWRRFS